VAEKLNFNKTMRKTVLWVLAVLVIVAFGAYFYLQQMNSASPAASQTPTSTDMAGMNATGAAPIASATYACDKGHTIQASYYEGSSTPALDGQPPVPGGWVVISLDGGATTTLWQTISADGARYSNGNPQIQQGQPGAETFVFWNKGNTALIMKNNAMDLTYTNCTAPTQH
jgi:membrane-bound inhibitor of C-type lysozyme